MSRICLPGVCYPVPMCRSATIYQAVLRQEKSCFVHRAVEDTQWLPGTGSRAREHDPIPRPLQTRHRLECPTGLTAANLAKALKWLASALV